MGQKWSNMEKKQTIKHFFPALTGYRAIAAWMIFVYHFTPFNSPKYPEWIKRIIWEFHIGVDMFIVLSGFLITYRYFNDRPVHLKKYLVNRIARIYPMYFLITAAIFVVGYLQNQNWGTEKTYELLTSVTMTKALFSSFFLKGIPQGWTLTLEEMFYLTAPLYFILIRKSKKWLYTLPFVLFIAFAALKFIFDFPANKYGFLQTNIHAYIIEFFAGIGLALLLLSKRSVKLKFSATWLGIGIILFYLLSRHGFAQIFNLKSDIGRFLEMAFLSILGIAPLLWGLIHENTFLKRLLSAKTMVLLGKSSYIFYLIHKGFIPVLINDYIWDNKLFIFILLNIISILLFIWIEEPLNHYIRKKFGSTKRT